MKYDDKKKSSLYWMGFRDMIFETGFRIGLTSDVPALLLLGKALALADVVEQVEVLADGDVVKEVEEQVHVLRTLGQNLLLYGCSIILIVTIST